MSKTCYVYIMRFKNGLHKIGMSGDPITRYNRLVNETIFKEDLVDIKFKAFKDRSNARVVEKMLHNKYKDYRYYPPKPFSGYTEFFKSDLPLDSVKADLLNSVGSCENNYFNPFIQLENLHKDLRMEVCKYIRKNKIYNRRFNKRNREVSLVLSCFLANILTGKLSYLLPESLKTSPICNKSRALLKLIKPRHLVELRRILEKYDVSISYTRRRICNFTKFIKDSYYKDKCGLPFINSLVSNNKSAPFYMDMVDGYQSILGFTDNCVVRKEK